MELSKSDKKVARIIIDKGLEQEYQAALAGAEAILHKWRSSGLSNQEAYLKMYAHVEKADKHIGRRYNALGGSRYFHTVTALYADGLVAEEDFEQLSEKVRAAVHLWLQL